MGLISIGADTASVVRGSAGAFAPIRVVECSAMEDVEGIDATTSPFDRCVLSGQSALMSNRNQHRLAIPQLSQASPEDGNRMVISQPGMTRADKVREFSQDGSIVGYQDETAALSMNSAGPRPQSYPFDPDIARRRAG